jgi:Tol biopolymer transport system component
MTKVYCHVTAYRYPIPQNRWGGRNSMRYLVAVIGLAAALYGADPAQTLQKGIDLMESKGDVPGAIRLFEGAAHSSDRAVAARALLYLGRAQERQGKERARGTYERIAHEFGDQRDIAAQARERLAALNGPTAGKTAALAARQLVCCWSGGNAGLEASPSPDGRLLALVHWETGDLAVRDLDTGEIRRFGLKTSWESSDFAQEPAFSHDQRQIAYTWFSAADQKYQLRVTPAEPGSKPRVLVNPSEVTYFTSSNWSPDGKFIFTLIWNQRDNTTRIASVSAADGAVKTLKSLEWRQPHGLSLSPDGRYLAYDVLERQDSTDRDIFILAVDGSSETAAVKNPGVDSDPVWTPDGSRLILNSNRSGNFGLYAVDVREGKAQGAARLLKPDAGRISLRGFVRSGALYYLQTTSDLNIYKAELDPATGSLRGAPAPLATTYVGNNSQAALSPDHKQIAYVSSRGAARQFGAPGGAGAWTVVVRSLDSQTEKTFAAAPDIRKIQWFGNNHALLLTERDPRRRRPLLYKLDLDSGAVSPLAPDANGLPQGYEYFPIGGIVEREPASGELKPIYKVDGDRRVWDLSLSPDGRMFAFTMGSAGPQQTRGVALVSRDGTAVRTLLEQPFKAPNPVWPGGGIAWSADGKRVFFVRNSKGEEREVYWMAADGGEPVATGIRGVALNGISVAGNTITYTAGVQNQVELWEFDNLLPLLKASR